MKKFKKIYIEITNHCNLSCSFCHQSMRPKAFIDPAVFTGILSRIHGHTDYISLHVMGEPLIHPELEKILNICQQACLQVNLTTNGTLLDKRRDVLLGSKALRQVNISLHSFSTEEKKQEIDDYLAGVFSFIKDSQRQGRLYICLRLWNKHAGSAYPESGKSAKDELKCESRQNELMLRKLRSFFCLPMPLADELTPGQGLTLAPRVFLSLNQQFTWPHAPGPDLGSVGVCRGLKDHIAILVDGTVVPCCLDAEADAPLGNILHESLPAILANPRAIKIIQGFARRQAVEPLCRRCSFKEKFITHLSSR